MPQNVNGMSWASIYGNAGTTVLDDVEETIPDKEEKDSYIDTGTGTSQRTETGKVFLGLGAMVLFLIVIGNLE